MFSIINISNAKPVDSANPPIVEAVALSTDTKPTDVGNGSKCTEMDTGTEYYYDAAGEQWLAFSNSGGGGGGGAVGVLKVNVAVDMEAGTFTCDKTAGEILQASQNGVVIYSIIHPETGDPVEITIGYTVVPGFEGEPHVFYAYSQAEVIPDVAYMFVAASDNDYPVYDVGGGTPT